MQSLGSHSKQKPDHNPARLPAASTYPACPGGFPRQAAGADLAPCFMVAAAQKTFVVGDKDKEQKPREEKK